MTPPASLDGARRVLFVLASAAAGAIAFAASWILLGIAYDALARIHPHQVVPTAAVTGMLGVPAGVCAAAVASIAGTRRGLRDVRATGRWLAGLWVLATAALLAWLVS